MISFPKIFFAFLLGSFLLVLIAINLFAPASQVSASAPVEDNNDKAAEKHTNNKINEDCAISQNYPDSIHQWCSIIMKEAKKFGLDPNFLAAVMLQESGGNPNAYSSSGAVGLMQIMPNDGIAEKFMCINGPCFTNRPSMQELYDPQFNVAFGAGMLFNLYGKYGDWRDALKAYGPMDIGYEYADIVMNIYQNY